MIKNKFYKNKIDFNFDSDDFNKYLNEIIHDWLHTLTALGFTLVPIFFILDNFTQPPELVPRFGVYRLISTVLVLVEYFIIKHTRPGDYSFYHGYFVSINIGGFIALMTVDLGGFNSSYYAGLNLVIIGVNLLLPWKTIHSALNSSIIILMYVAFNLMSGQEYRTEAMTNNLFFLTATAIIAVSINHVKHRLVKKEFFLLVELKKARDAIWSEMELAKRIQTALLPEKKKISGYEISAVMKPAKEVGGDYYDIIETPAGDRWVAIGDVSGHGVDSGLIMMMAQTSIVSMVNNFSDCEPSSILKSVNTVIRENILRLGSDHYMTLMAIHLEDTRMTLSGKHQDVIIYRSALNKTEVLPTIGTWLGISDDIEEYLQDIATDINEGDIVLLFTDGVSEATNKDGVMYGQERLEQALNQHADLPVGRLLERLVEDINNFQDEQVDDITLVVIKKNSIIGEINWT